MGWGWSGCGWEWMGCDGITTATTATTTTTITTATITTTITTPIVQEVAAVAARVHGSSAGVSMRMEETARDTWSTCPVRHVTREARGM